MIDNANQVFVRLDNIEATLERKLQIRRILREAELILRDAKQSYTSRI